MRSLWLPLFFVALICSPIGLTLAQQHRPIHGHGRRRSKIAAVPAPATPLPEPLSGLPYHHLAVRELYTYDPNNPTVVEGPLMGPLNMTYNPEQPCPPHLNCPPCPSNPHIGCYRVQKVYVRMRAARGWVPGPNDVPWNRGQINNAFWQASSVRYRPLNAYLSAPLPTASEYGQFGVLYNAPGFENNHLDYFHQPDTMAAHPDIRVIVADPEFRPWDSQLTSSEVNSASDNQLVRNIAADARLFYQSLIQLSQGNPHSEWYGLVNENALVDNGHSVGGMLGLINNLGYPNAGVPSYTECAQCLGEIAAVFTRDPSTWFFNSPLLAKLNTPMFQFGSQSLEPTQSMPAFAANLQLFWNYLLVVVGTIHNTEGAPSMLTVIDALAAAGLDNSGYPAAFYYPNATEVIGKSLGAQLYWSVAGWAAMVEGQQNYAQLLLTPNAYQDQRIHFFHAPIGQVDETYDNIVTILDSNSQGSQSSSSSPTGIIDSQNNYLHGYIIRPDVCVFGMPPPLSLLQSEGLLRQEANGAFAERICLAR